VIAGTVGDLAQRLSATPLDGPVLVMIGHALAAVQSSPAQQDEERTRASA
jgi:hypothetical protein